MKKILSFMVLGLALCTLLLPNAVTDAVAYDLQLYILSFDDEIYPGDIWDCSIRIYNPC